MSIATLSIRKRDEIKMTNGYYAATVVIIITLGVLLAVYIVVLVKFAYMRRKRKKQDAANDFGSPVSLFPWHRQNQSFVIPPLMGTSTCQRVQPRTFEELDKV